MTSYKRLQNAITKRLESADELSTKGRQHVQTTIVPQLSEEEVISNYKQIVLGHMRNIIHNQKNEGLKND